MTMRSSKPLLLLCGGLLTLVAMTSAEARTPPKSTSTIGTAVVAPPMTLKPGESLASDLRVRGDFRDDR